MGLEELVEHANDAVLELDGRGRIATWNVGAERMFGFPQAAALGQPFDRFTVPAAWHTAAQQLLDAARTVRTVRAELQRERSDGRLLTVEALIAHTGEGFTVRYTDRSAQLVLTSAIDLIPEPIVVTDERGSITMLNQHARGTFGVDASVVGQALTTLLPSGEPRVGRRGDGSTFPVEVRQSSVRGAQAEYTCHTIHDLTPLAALEGQLQALLEMSPDALVITNQNRVIIGVNERACAMFGRARDAMIGMSSLALLSPRNPPPPSREQVLAMRQTDFIGLRADGSEFTLNASASLLPGSTNFVAAMRDVTELRAEEATFRGLLETAPDAMVIIEPSGSIHLINARTEALFGYSRDELIGQPVEILMNESFHARHREHRAAYSRDPHTRAMGTGIELQARRKDGTLFPVEISLSPLRTTRTLYSAAIRDVTDRKQLEAKLREANQFKSQFITHLAHELRTPLNAVVGFSDLLGRGRSGELQPDQREFVQHISTASQHLLRLVNDMLDLAKVESGTMEFVTGLVDIHQLVAEVRDILSGMAMDKSQQIVLDLSPSLHEVTVDPARVKQVLYNFLSNAIKYTPARGRVTIRARIDSDPALFRLEVSDTGPGIAESDRARLFREFQQLDNAGRGNGTGLGLALAKRVVEGHGGRIEVVSRPGEGSTFSAILPRRPGA